MSGMYTTENHIDLYLKPTQETYDGFQRAYSQGELSEIGKQAGKRAQLSELLQFVQPEFKREDERLNAAIEDGKLAVRKAIQALSTAWIQQASIQKLQTAKSSLEQRLAALQKTLPQLPADDQQTITRYDALVLLDAKRQQAERQAQSVMCSAARQD